MNGPSKQSGGKRPSRRDFIKRSSVLVASGAVAGTLSIARSAHAYGSEEIKIGLIGCGGRGSGATHDALSTKGPVKLVAMADAFNDQLQKSLRGLSSQFPTRVDVPRHRQFIGFDAYEYVLKQDIDLVILATPPGFRPIHFEAAVQADKDIFMEKPVAVDAPGVRRVLAANEEVKKKNLAVAVGLQRHHEPKYKETIARLQDGAIGDVILTRAYWNSGGVWTRARKPQQSEMEYQMRNWYYFNWLCGDHIVEQHIHNLDVINWLMNGYPVSAQGQGGRLVRNGADHGEIFDHHFVEFTYANGSKLLSQCRHIPNCWSAVSEHAHGSKGTADISGAKIYDAKGDRIWHYGPGGGGGHQQEHHDLMADLRAGKRPNEAEYGAMSTMTSIFGRMATYAGTMLSWDEAINSDIDLSPAAYSFNAPPPVVPNDHGRYAVAVPGLTKTV